MAVWSPFIEEYLNTEVEPDNVHDQYTVKILKNEAVVGHVPREISRYCSFREEQWAQLWRPRKQERKWTDSTV